MAEDWHVLRQQATLAPTAKAISLSSKPQHMLTAGLPPVGASQKSVPLGLDNSAVPPEPRVCEPHTSIWAECDEVFPGCAGLRALSPAHALPTGSAESPLS